MRWHADVAELLHTIVVRMLALLERRGVIDTMAEPALIDDVGAERDRALSALAAASVTGLAPAGPERRKRPPIALRADTGLRFSSALSATQAGFSLHAATTAAADDDAGREALCKYVLRPPITQDRLRLLDDGLVPPVGDHEARRIDLERALSVGTVAVDLDPLSLLCRLATAVPPPRFHVVRYAGVLASAHKWRSLVVPPRPAGDDSDETGKHEHAHEGATGWYQSGQYSLSPVGGRGRIAAGDFNGDGKDDIALLRNNGSSGAGSRILVGGAPP